MPRSSKRKVLIVVENLPVPFDRRVWQEATTLKSAGYEVSVICPKGAEYVKSHEILDDIRIYRHPLPLEADGALGYAVEYSIAVFWEFVLATRVWAGPNFDVIHACNPPDLIFLLGRFFRMFGKRFVFDHHDVNPELYEAKFQRRDFFYKLLVLLERWTFNTADISIATNESYRRIAMKRGGMAPDSVFVVRSGPSLDRMRQVPPDNSLKKNRKYMVGYVGTMGKQEGIDYLLRAADHIIHVDKRTDIQFGLVGGGTELEDMKRLAKEFGIEDFVTFTGRVPDNEMLVMLNTADICVNPDVANSMNDISTMNKIMEYMALAKPIVQFDLTEGRVSAGAASLYALPNNHEDLAAKILELLAAPERRSEMGRIGRKRIVEKLSWEFEAPKLLAAYDALWSRFA